MTRLSAIGSALAATGGAATMLVAVLAQPGAWWEGYVSEAGTTGHPYAIPYRCGLVLLAAGAALLGRALRPLRVAAAALLAAAVLAATSGLVACSESCPLPPYEPTTVADVVHAAASVLGMVALAGAMAVVRLRGPGTAIRRLAGVAVALTVPLGAVLGAIMLFAGRGTAGALIERVVLVVAVCWLIGTALLLAAGRGGQPRGPGERGVRAAREDPVRW